MTRMGRAAVRWAIAACVAGGWAARAEVYQWNGSNSTAWTVAANWQPSAGSTFAGPGPTGGTYNSRLNVNNGLLNELVYDAALGDTVYASTTNFLIPSRGLVIGSGASGSGRMRITGGSFSTLGSAASDVVGNNSNTGILHLDGGSFTGTDQGLNLGLGFGPVARLIVTNGTATVAVLSLNATTSSVELDGGTLAARQVLGLGGAMTINFNGGLLQARTNSGSFLGGLSRANVRDNGARVDTAGFDITIAQALHHSNLGGDAATDGGLVKSGLGALTLSATNTYTGPTAVQTGALYVNGSLAGGAVTVDAGARLGGAGAITGDVATAAGATLDPGGAAGTVGTLTLAGSWTASGGDTVRVDVASATNLDRIVVESIANPLGVTTIELRGAPGALPGGSHVLIEAGSLLGDSNSFEVVAPLSRLASFDIAYDLAALPQQVLLVVTPGGGPSNLVWSGTAGQWDVGQTTNWQHGAGADVYLEGDFVTFDATGVAQSNVNLVAPVAPGAVVVDTSGGGYRLSSTNGSRVTGPARLTLDGGGALVLDVVGEYTGGTVILSGTLIAGPAGQLGPGAVTNHGTLTLEPAGALVFSNEVSGAGTFEHRGTGRVVVAATISQAGGIRIGPGELRVGTGGLVGSLSTGSLTNDGILAFERGDLVVLPAPLSGPGALHKLGTGTLALAQSSDYTGPTIISNGAVLVSATGALGAASAGTTVAFGGCLALTGGLSGVAAEPLFIHGPGIPGSNYFGASAAVQRGALQSVGGSNEWTGPIIFDGTGGNTRIGVQEGAQLVLRGSLTEGAPGSSINFRHGTVSGDLILAGAGQWSGSTFIFGGGGAVKLGADDALATGAVLQVGATGIPGESRFDLNGHDQTVAGLVRAAAVPVRVVNQGPAPSTLTLWPTTPLVYYGALEDGPEPLSLTKRGAETQGLGSSATYRGRTLVAEGTLDLIGAGAISNSTSVVIAAGAVLGVTQRTDRAFTVGAAQVLRGAGLLAGNLVNDGRVEPGLSAGRLSVGGSFTQRFATLALEIGGPAPATEHDVLAVAGAAALDGILDVAFSGGYTGLPGQVFTVLTASAVSGGFIITNLPPLHPDLVWQVTYEPTALVLTISNTVAGASPYETWSLAIPDAGQRFDLADPDGDGFANLWEYSQGTDPTNGVDGMEVVIVRTGGVHQLKFNRATGAVDLIYQVESTGVPTNTADWSILASNVLGAGWSGPGGVVETNSGPVVQAFASDADPLATNRTLRLRVIRP